MRNPENEYEAVWASFMEEADELPEAMIARPPTPGKALGDRLAYLTLEGYLPIFALSALLLSLSAGHTSVTSWVAGLLMTPFVALAFQPLARTRHGLRTAGLWLLSLPLLLASSVASGVGRLTEHHLTTGRLHPEFVALAWQESLESLLSPTAALVISVVLILLSFILQWTHRRFPWIQLKHRPARWVWLAPLSILALLLVSLFWLFSAVRIDSQTESWLQRARGLSQERRFSSLPSESEDRYWQDLMDELDRRLKANRTPTLHGNLYWTPENIRDAVAGMPVPPLDSHPPASKAELEAASNYLSWMGDGNIESVRLQPSLDSVMISQLSRPRRDSGDWTWLMGELLKKFEKSADEDTIRRSLEKFRTIRAALEPPEEGLEERAYHLLVTDLLELSSGKEIGWKPVDDLVRPDKFTRGWAYTANPAPRPLRVLDFEFEHSPTMFGSFLQRRRLQRDWVEFLRESDSLSWEQRMEGIRARRDLLPIEGTVEDTFWKALLEWETVPQEIVILKQAELWALLKLYRLKNSHYPKNLDGLKKQIDFGDELGRFHWDPSTGSLDHE